MPFYVRGNRRNGGAKEIQGGKLNTCVFEIYWGRSQKCFARMIVGRANLVEVAENLATSTLAPGLLVIHDAARGGEHDETELTRGQEIGDPLLNVLQLNVEARADDATLVDATNQLDNNLAAAVVIDDFELANVTCAVPIVS
jgi:hypothetical protein